LYKGIKGKFAGEEIWMGGGSNPDIQCPYDVLGSAGIDAE
jgi:hypothetical protein